LTADELGVKFRANAGRALPPDKVDALLAAVGSLPSAPSATPLLRLTVAV
jgi:hypothetical protein